MEEKNPFSFQEFVNFVVTTRRLLNTMLEKLEITENIFTTEQPHEAFANYLLSLPETQVFEELENEWIKSILSNPYFLVTGFVYFGDAAFITKTAAMKESTGTPLDSNLANLVDISKWVITLVSGGISLFTWGLLLWRALQAKEKFSPDDIKLIANAVWEAMVACIVSKLNLGRIYQEKSEGLTTFIIPKEDNVN